MVNGFGRKPTTRASFSNSCARLSEPWPRHEQQGAEPCRAGDEFFINFRDQQKEQRSVNQRHREIENHQIVILL